MKRQTGRTKKFSDVETNKERKKDKKGEPKIKKNLIITDRN